jgi:gluconolactonase
MASPPRSGELEALIDPAARPRRLGGSFQFSEGPAWNAREACLVFSDIPGDARWRWSEAGGLEEVMRPTFKANGMAYEADGSLLACEQVTSCLVRFRPEGERELVAFHHGGAYLNSPNDVVVRASDGSIYFTDPDFGRWNDWIGCKRTAVLGFKAVFRVPGGRGETELVVDEHEFDQPNGLCFSPDERVLYVNDSPRGHIKAFDVAAEGSLSGGRVLAEGITTGDPARGAPDGMECDERGNVWTTGPGGIWVVSPSGEVLGVVETPEVAGSLAWGGPDLRSLFLTCKTSLYVVDTLVAGARLPGPA